MRIKINGRAEEIAENSTILDLLRTKELNPELVVVELNRDIIKRELFNDTLLNDSDQMEILHLVGGG